MALPRPARERLAAPIREALNEKTKRIRDWHTLPVHRRVWSSHSRTLIAAINDFERACQRANLVLGDYAGTRDWVQEIVDRSARTFSVLLALQPFEPFNQRVSVRVATVIDAALRDIAHDLENGQPVQPSLRALQEVQGEWPSEGGMDTTKLLSAAFGTAHEPLDDDGEFSPGRVFEAYKQNNGRLLQQILPHLASLGLGLVDDSLAMLCAPGWILVAEDQVVAYSAMDRWMSRLFNPASTAERLIDTGLALTLQDQLLGSACR